MCCPKTEKITKSQNHSKMSIIINFIENQVFKKIYLEVNHCDVPKNSFGLYKIHSNVPFNKNLYISKKSG